MFTSEMQRALEIFPILNKLTGLISEMSLEEKLQLNKAFEEVDVCYLLSQSILEDEENDTICIQRPLGNAREVRISSSQI